MADGLALAQAVCTRLCHDLGGPAGALSGALEMLEDGTDEAAEVARDAARLVDRRLRFWRMAVGGAGTDLDRDTIAQLAEALTLGRRATVDLGALPAEALIPPALAQPLLLAMLIGVEAMPRGGVLRVGGSPAEGIAVRPDGPGAAWPAGLPALLAGDTPALTPRTIALPLLVALAASGKVMLDLAMGGISPGPLVLTMRR
jgi:histidine phosphotransferase ChpT